jgi:hypothetical protein
MCRCDIADYLGLTVETVCRELSDPKRCKVIEVSPHSVRLLDRFTLEAIGDECHMLARGDHRRAADYDGGDAA